MAKPPELLVIGRDLASYALTAFAASAGLAVSQVVPAGESPPFGGLVWGDELGAASERWVDEAPLEKPITGRRLAVLTDSASVGLEFQDHRAASRAESVRSVRCARLADWLRACATEHGAPVRSGRPGGLVRRAGRVVGIEVDGQEVPATVVALGAGAGAGRAIGHRRRRSRLFALTPQAVQERFGPGPGRATCVEAIVGGRRADEASVGFVLPYTDAVEVGVDVRSDGDLDEASAWALDRLQEHPDVARLLRGAPPPVDSADPPGPDAPPSLGGRGWIAVGPELGLGVSAGPGCVPSLTHELRRAASASRAAVEAIRGGGDPSAVAPKYRHYLADAGVLRDHAADRARDRRYRFQARWQQEYPTALAGLLGALMTEVNGPKRRVLRTVREAGGSSGLAWSRLAADLLSAGGTL